MTVACWEQLGTRGNLGARTPRGTAGHPHGKARFIGEGDVSSPLAGKSLVVLWKTARHRDFRGWTNPRRGAG